MPIEYDYIDDEDSDEDVDTIVEIGTEEEMADVDIWEFSLDDEEIDELIEGLRELKETKAHFHFDLDEENELLIHHEDETYRDEFEGEDEE